MRFLLLTILLLPGCDSLGFLRPWPTSEEVEQGDAETLAEADRLAAERVKAHENDLPPPPVLDPPPPLEEGGGWPDRLFELAVLILGGGGAGAALTRLLRGPGERKVKVARASRPKDPPSA